MMPTEPKKMSYWPGVQHFDNNNHWNGFIPLNALKQLSAVIKSPDFKKYTEKGYRPYLNVKGESFGELSFVNPAQPDTVLIWSTAVKGPYKWDKKLIRVKAKVSNGQILLLY